MEEVHDRRGKYPLTMVRAALNGTTNVTLVSAPPAGEARRVTRVYGQNNAGGNRTMTLYLNDNGTVIPIHSSQVTADTAISAYEEEATVQPPIPEAPVRSTAWRVYE